ncbi:MAG: prolipoprotein diacylglyceryl transferase [Vampirovibrionales bacterium]|nr:prolipoprotein diacylglyceryl transferase [Vampirovibrionales bacterium]
MHPVLFWIGPYPVYSFGVLIAIALLLAYNWGNHRLLNAGLRPEQYQSLWLWLLIPALLGAKAFYAIWFWEQFTLDPLGTLLNRGGLVWYGGVVGALLGLWFFAKRASLSLLNLLDALTLPVLAGLALGRIGCLLAGCCFGAPCLLNGTPLPWAVYYPPGHLSHPHGVHPSPIYEALGAIALLIVLKFRQHQFSQGILTACTLIGLGGLRFIVEMTRGDTLKLLALSVSQWLSLMMLVAGVILFVSLRQAEQTAPHALASRKKPETSPGEAP